MSLTSVQARALLAAHGVLAAMRSAPSRSRTFGEGVVHARLGAADGALLDVVVALEVLEDDPHAAALLEAWDWEHSTTLDGPDA